jgi:hypothetical protein
VEANRVIENTFPVLCGGTFFTLLLEARQARSGKKEPLYGSRDGLSEPDVLAGLVRVMYPEYKTPSGESTFRTNTADYKACRNNGGNLPFFDKEIRAFDNRVINDYPTALMLMCEFVNQYIEVGGSVKRDEWLIKALIDLIDNDKSIHNADAFYVCDNGQALTKESLCSVCMVSLPAFLLGVWHFTVVNRRDNTMGQGTFDEWCPSNNRKPRVYTADMGESISRAITVTMPVTVNNEDNPKANADDEPPICFDEQTVEAEILDSSFAQDNTSGTSSGSTKQVLKNQAIFHQYGNNNVQVNSVDTLIIKND